MTSYEDIKSKLPKKIGEVIAKSEDNENFIIKVSDDKIYEVVPVAYYIWEMCDGSHTVEQIVDEISREAGIPAEQLRETVALIISELEKASLISI
ncbi:MAG: PqqD family protein [Sulfolobaceae archaeon]